MASLTIDPHNPDDLALVARLLGTAAPVDTPLPSDSGLITGDHMYTTTYNRDGTGPAAPGSQAESIPPESPPVGDADPNSTDIHGMKWDEAIHSNPPSKNADGSWRARRGKKDEYEAAIAAHKSAAAQDAGQALADTAQPDTTPDKEHVDADTPPAMPAAPAPTTPPEPIAYETMAARFVQMMQEARLPAGFEAIYQGLDVNHEDLTTNQTSIARLWHYMDAVDDKQDHSSCVRHALGMVS